MIAVAAAGGQTIVYSPRFTLTDMTGIFLPTVLTGANAVDGTDGPPDVDQVSNNPGGPAAAGDFAVPFGEQTGLTRYAPMQKVPPTKISAKGYTPMYPTSSVNIATTFLPVPSVQTTVTQAPTFVPDFKENPVRLLSFRPHLGSSLFPFNLWVEYLRVHQRDMSQHSLSLLRVPERSFEGSPYLSTYMLICSSCYRHLQRPCPMTICSGSSTGGRIKPGEKSFDQDIGSL